MVLLILLIFCCVLDEKLICVGKLQKLGLTVDPAYVGKVGEVDLGLDRGQVHAVRLLFHLLDLDQLFWGLGRSHLVIATAVLEEVLIVVFLIRMELKLLLLVALMGRRLEHMVSQLLLNDCGSCASFGVDDLVLLVEVEFTLVHGLETALFLMVVLVGHGGSRLLLLLGWLEGVVHGGYHGLRRGSVSSDIVIDHGRRLLQALRLVLRG